MKTPILLVALFLNLWSLGQTPASDPHWRLVLGDEFDSPQLDEDLWRVMNWAQHGEGELQLYLEEQVEVVQGSLRLWVDDVPTLCVNPADLVPAEWHETGFCGPCTENDMFNYISGAVETRNAHYKRYGFIESRIKMSHSFGFWPAFWTCKGGSQPPEANAAEIDIFEMVGHQPPSVMGTNVHLDYCTPCIAPDCQCNSYLQPLCPWQDPSILCRGMDVFPPNFNYTTWNTYGLEWSPTRIVWYVNDVPVRVFENPGVVGLVRIILNLAIPSGGNSPIGSTAFPGEMLVDYVRVYQVRNDCGTAMLICDNEYGQQNPMVKHSITVGDGTCSNDIADGHNIFLRAATEVVINGEFTVPLGGELFVEVMGCGE